MKPISSRKVVQRGDASKARAQAIIRPANDSGVIQRIAELTVNWHIREGCNFACNFCFAKYDNMRSRFASDYPAVLEELSRLPGKRLNLPSGSIIADRVRINFAGGEPFLERRLNDAIAKSYYLGLSPSVITNGFFLTDEFIRMYGPQLSTVGISVDSFEVRVNREIGRQDKRGLQLTPKRLSEIFRLFRAVSPGTKLKINTVVCQENVAEDLSDSIVKLAPDRWKLLRVIPIHGAVGRGVSDEQYQAFINRHRHVSGKTALELVTEDNDEMARSYLMLNPEGCFYQRNGSEYETSNPVATVGAQAALEKVWFDAPVYSSRYTHHDTNK